MACRLAASSTISTRAPLPPRSKPANLCSGCLFRLTVHIGRKEPSLSAAHFHVAVGVAPKRHETRGVLMLSLGAALAAVALVPATASAGHGHWGGGTVATVGTATGMAGAGWGGMGGPGTGGGGVGGGGGVWGGGGWGGRVYVGPRYGGCWAPGYDWVPCRRWWW